MSEYEYRVSPYGAHLEIVHNSKRIAIIKADAIPHGNGSVTYRLTPEKRQMAQRVALLLGTFHGLTNAEVRAYGPEVRFMKAEIITLRTILADIQSRHDGLSAHDNRIYSDCEEGLISSKSLLSRISERLMKEGE